MELRWIISFGMWPCPWTPATSYSWDFLIATDFMSANLDLENWMPMFMSLYANMFWERNVRRTVYPKKYAHGFCFAVLCCGYTLTDFPISTRLTSLALWQSNDCPSAGKATLMNMDKYFMWNHYERLHNHNKAKHNKTVCIFIGIYCIYNYMCIAWWRHDMETLSALPNLCVGKHLGGFTGHGPVMRSFDV